MTRFCTEDSCDRRGEPLFCTCGPDAEPDPWRGCDRCWRPRLADVLARLHRARAERVAS